MYNFEHVSRCRKTRVDFLLIFAYRSNFIWYSTRCWLNKKSVEKSILNSQLRYLNDLFFHWQVFQVNQKINNWQIELRLYNNLFFYWQVFSKSITKMHFSGLSLCFENSWAWDRAFVAPDLEYYQDNCKSPTPPFVSDPPLFREIWEIWVGGKKSDVFLDPAGGGKFWAFWDP